MNVRNQLVRAVYAFAVFASACAEPAAPPAETANPPQATGTAAPGAAAAPTAAAARPAPAQPARPRFREVTIPSGTVLNLTLDTAVSSNGSKVEDPVRAKLVTALVINGTTVLPAGTEATGTVFDAQQSGRVKGRATVSFGFDRLRSGQASHAITAARITREAEATKSEDATKIGIGAGAGAIIGAIAGGAKGAAIGTAVGAGAGTGAVLATRGEEVSLPVGTAVETTLEQPLRIQVAIE